MHECKLLAPSPQLMIQWWGTRPSPTSPSGKLPSPASDSSHLGHRTDQKFPCCRTAYVKLFCLLPCAYQGWQPGTGKPLLGSGSSRHPEKNGTGTFPEGWTETQPTPAESERRSCLSRLLFCMQGCVHVGRGVKQACNCALKQGLSQVRGPLSQTFPEAKVLHLNSSMW